MIGEAMKADPVDLQRRLGVAIQRRRGALGLTQALVAERSDVSLKYYGEIERGTGNVTIRTLARVAVALEWDPWTLFSTAQQPVSKEVHGFVLTELTDFTSRLVNLRAWFASLDPTLRADAESDGAEYWARCAVAMNTGIAALRAGLDDGALSQGELCPVMTALADALPGSRLEPSDEMRSHLKACDICTEQMRRLFARDVGANRGREVACPIMAAFVSEQPASETALTEEMRTHLASCEVCIEEIAELGVSRALDRLRQGMRRSARFRDRRYRSN